MANEEAENRKQGWKRSVISNGSFLPCFLLPVFCGFKYGYHEIIDVRSSGSGLHQSIHRFERVIRSVMAKRGGRIDATVANGGPGQRVYYCAGGVGGTITAVGSGGENRY